VDKPWFGYYYRTQERKSTRAQEKVGIFFPRSLLIKNDLELIDLLIKKLEEKNILPVAVFAQKKEYGGKDCPGLEAGLKLLKGVDLIINCESSFLIQHAIGKENEETILDKIGVPIIQTVYSSSRTEKEWEESPQGISPTNQIYWVAHPEFNGAIEPIVVAAKESSGRMHPTKSAQEDTYGRRKPIEERVEFLIDRISAWLKLYNLPVNKRKVTFLLHNNPCAGVETSVGGGSGLDTLESVVRMMKEMQKKGYNVIKCPETGKELIDLIMNKKAISEFRWTTVEEIVKKGGVVEFITMDKYNQWLNKLSHNVREKMVKDWGEPPGKSMVHNGNLVVTGLKFGNIHILAEPKRGCYGAKCDGEVCKILHDPKIAPTHQCLATYKWAQENSDMIISVGTHGYIEFLPGKSVGMSAECFPEIITGTKPHLYIYTIKNPAEGILAKRRAYAVIIDHMIPAMKKFESYGELTEIEELLEQYQKTIDLDEHQRGEVILDEIIKLSQKNNLIVQDDSAAAPQQIIKILHEKIELIKSSKINIGMHILSKVPIKKGKEGLYSCIIEHTKIRKNKFFEKLEMIKREIPQVLAGIEKKHIQPGPAGLITRGKIEVLPTGRNFYCLDPRTIPTKAAWQVGIKMAEGLLNKYLKEEDRYPENIGMVLWSIDAYRADGEQISQILYLLGARPIWAETGVVKGTEIIPLKELKRPRIDVTIRTSGIFRDTLPHLFELLDETIQKIASLNEPKKMNFIKKHVLEYIEKHNCNGRIHATKDTSESWRQATYRLFCAQPGTYGNGVKLMIAASAWKTMKDLGEIYIERGGYAYGREIFGQVACEEYAHRLSSVQAVFHKLETDETDPLGCCFYDFQGGMYSAVKSLSGNSPKVLWGDTRDPQKPQTRDMKDEIERAVRTRLLNPEWIEGMKRHGYKGAGDMAHKVVAVYGWDASAEVVDDWIFDDLTKKYVLDKEMRKFFEDNNPWALEEISRRLLEAEKRGVWKADPQVLKELQDNYLEIESWMEEKMGDAEGEYQGGNVDILTKVEVEGWTEKTHFNIDDFLLYKPPRFDSLLRMQNESGGQEKSLPKAIFLKTGGKK